MELLCLCTSVVNVLDVRQRHRKQIELSDRVWNQKPNISRNQKLKAILLTFNTLSDLPLNRIDNECHLKKGCYAHAINKS